MSQNPVREHIVVLAPQWSCSIDAVAVGIMTHRWTPLSYIMQELMSNRVEFGAQDAYINTSSIGLAVFFWSLGRGIRAERERLRLTAQYAL